MKIYVSNLLTVSVKAVGEVTWWVVDLDEQRQQFQYLSFAASLKFGRPEKTTSKEKSASQ